nr:MAG: hypothetical protein [Porcellio scaber clopovirus]
MTDTNINNNNINIINNDNKRCERGFLSPNDTMIIIIIIIMVVDDADADQFHRLDN